MDRNKKIAIEILEEIDRARSGHMPLNDLETKLWRLLDATESGFPPVIAGQVEDFVLEIQKLQKENRFWMGSGGDENRGVDQIYNEVNSSIARFLD